MMAIKSVLFAVVKAARFIIAPFVLIALCAYWFVLVIVTVPVILIDQVLGITRRRHAGEPSEWSASTSCYELFDRRTDVSKLHGCNTRNVRYRWTLFEAALSAIEDNSRKLRALDFGAGSLRDSYELALRGYAVTSVDLNGPEMAKQAEAYRWTATVRAPEIVAGPLDQLAGQQFDAITSFDVLEHAEDPEEIVRQLAALLDPKGVWLVTVPNGRSLYEKHARIEITVKRHLGVPWPRGVPHLHFRTPGEWRELFERNGLRVRAHDMAIGFLVNDMCHTVFRVPLQWIVSPIISRLLAPLGIPFDRERFARRFFPRWLVEPVDLVDRLLKPIMHGLFGWNLFVLERRDVVVTD